MEEEPGASDQDSDAGSEEVLTPAELISKLEEAWLNEKFAPELLESKSEIVECVMEQLNHMEQNLQRARQGDLKISFHHMEIERIRFMLSSYLRSRLVKPRRRGALFIISKLPSDSVLSYCPRVLCGQSLVDDVRVPRRPADGGTRLHIFTVTDTGILYKIEKFFPHVLEKEKARGEGEPPHLSPEEFAFAKEYMANTETLLKSVAFRHMPPNLQTVDMLKCVPKPNLDSFVFLKVKQAQENILVEPETDEQSEYAIDMEVGSQHLIRYRTIAPLVASGAVKLL